jgi:hypothetical protein
MRIMRCWLYTVLAVSGCASAGKPNDQVDSGIHLQDSNNTTHPDAPASTTSDSSSGCTVVTTDLLQNGAFDGSPVGTGWTATPVNPTYPIVTPQDGIVEQSPVNKAWMGGIAQASAMDDLHQDVAVPPSTTMLVLTGYYEVRTGETGTTVYDSGKVELVQTGGTLIEAVQSLDNAHATTAWTPINHTFTATSAGQTVRLRFTTRNDFSNPTSFYFDTLALQATYCQ